MHRRRFVQLIASWAALATTAPHAQSVRKTARVGLLWGTGPDATGEVAAAFKQGMRELGWIEKQNVDYFERHAYGELGRCAALATELLGDKVDVILTGNGDVAKEAAKAVGRLPLVFATSADPVGAGIVASLARPGGNITGFSTFNAQLAAKRVELLKEIRPQIKRIAVLTSAVAREVSVDQITDAARALGLELHTFRVQRAEDIPQAFDGMARIKAEGLLVVAASLLVSESRQIIERSAKLRVPALFARSDIVARGGFMSYAPDFADNHRRAAGYVDRILKGATPNDLPIQQPTKFDLVVNLKTAKALGIAIPSTILLRADKVIE